MALDSIYNIVQWNTESKFWVTTLKFMIVYVLNEVYEVYVLNNTLSNIYISD